VTAYTLWRGGTLLGRIEPFPDGPALPAGPSPGMFMGLLRPTAAFAGTQPVFQSQDIFGRGAMQRPMDTVEVSGEPLAPIPLIDIPPEPPLPPAWTEAEQEDPIELPPLEGGVPDSERLDIRADDGTSVDCWTIAIIRSVPRAGLSDDGWRKEFGSLARAPEVWAVSAFVNEPL
jgi:hypothetical protein